MTALPPAPTRTPYRTTNTLAIIGFIAAFMVPIAGIVLGVMGRRQIRETGEDGDGLALGAIVIGAVLSGLIVLFVIIWIVMMVLIFGSVIWLGGAIQPR